MRRFFSSIVDLRKGEKTITLLMFLYYYLILVTYYFLKPARDSLFLVELGPAQLPIVFMIIAVVMAPITSVYASASRSMRLTRLTIVTSGLIVLSLVILRWLLGLGESWVFYVFYIWVSIYGALTAAQYWLFANAIYTPAQAKRLFPFLSLGGILGAITGGEVTAFIVRTIGISTEDLLIICIMVVVAFAALARLTWMIHVRKGAAQPRSSRRDARTRGDSFGQMVALIKRSRHLSYLVGIVALTMASASFIDFQFKTASAQAYPDTEQLTSFLGTFYGRLSLVSLLLHVVATKRLIQVLGVGGITMFLPLCLLFGSGFMLVAPGLLAAMMIRGTFGAFTYSLDKTGRELLFMPIPLEVKKRTKVFIDMFVDRGSRGLAGVLLLLLTSVLGWTTRSLSIVVIVMLSVWLLLLILIRKEYVDAFRLALQRRELDPSQLDINVHDPTTVATLRESLGSDNEREVAYALGMLAGSQSASLAADLEPLLKHSSVDVRRRALEVLTGLDPTVAIAGVEPLTRDPDGEVRAWAMNYVCRSAPARALAVIGSYLDDSDPRVAATALRCAAEHGGEAGARLVSAERVGFLVKSEGGGSMPGPVRADVARALGILGGESVRTHLMELADDGDAAVARAALEAMGRTGDLAYVSPLLIALGDGRRRRAAREALATIGDGVIDPIFEILTDAAAPLALRRGLPSVLARIPSQRSVDALIVGLADTDSIVRFRVVKALGVLRRNYADLLLPVERVDDAFEQEVRRYYKARQFAALLRPYADRPSDRLLSRALEERLTSNLERAFRILGLRYPASDIYNAYLGIVGDRRDQQASALELLDNVLKSDQKKLLFPIIDQVSERDTTESGRQLFGVRVRSRTDALLTIIRGSDPWLRACAVYCSLELAEPELREAVANAASDPDPRVAQTARLAPGSG